MYTPILPTVTLAELREDSPEQYRLFNAILMNFAKDVYSNEVGCKYGLEGCIETMESLVEKGHIKLIWNEEDDTIALGVFNPSTGNYETVFNDM